MMNNNGQGGDPSLPRYGMPPSNHTAPDRRRRGKNMSVNGNYYHSGPQGGPRDNRMGKSYRGDGRMVHRTSGGSGDGMHTGSGNYRGGNSDFEQPYGHPHSGMSHHSQCSTPSGDGHLRGGHSHQSSQHHHHNQQQMSSSQEIVVVPTSMQDHQFQAVNSGALGHVGNQAFPGAAPQQIPTPVPPQPLGFFGFHPNSQPMMGSLALCHIPYGVNPSSVISPAVYTQIIGAGYLSPGLPYNYRCAFPSPLIPSHPVILQPAAHPQQPVQHFPQSAGPHNYPGGGIHEPPQGSGDECMGFDSSSLLNPDADAFFPPQLLTEDDVMNGGNSICNEPETSVTSENKSEEHSSTQHVQAEEDDAIKDLDSLKDFSEEGTQT